MCIRDRAFLAREYKVLAVFVIAVAGLLAVVNSQGRAGQTPLVAAAFVVGAVASVSYTHLRAHETVLDLVCRLLLEKKKKPEHAYNTALADR